MSCASDVAVAHWEVKGSAGRAHEGRCTGMTDTPAGWWARGLIFENCACTLVCPGHMHFSQLCTHERCKGYWAFRKAAAALDRRIAEMGDSLFRRSYRRRME